MDDGEFPVAVRRGGRAVTFAATAREILRRTAEGESLRSICRDAHMPAEASVVCKWARQRPGFAAALLEARQAAGGPFTGGRSSYCEATARAIVDRIAAGEALTRVCLDPDMPVAATVYKWRAEHEDFGHALAVAYELRAEGFFERGWELAEAATPQTAYLTHVRLAQLRWHVSKLAPKKYGAIKPVEAATEEAGGGGLQVYLKNFILDRGDGPARESEEPAELLYSMTPAQMRGDFKDGEPHPANVAWEAREPQREAYRQGFFARKRARIAINGNVMGGDPDPDYWDGVAARAEAKRQADGAEEPDYWAAVQTPAGMKDEDLL
jgi:hypothetical protein